MDFQYFVIIILQNGNKKFEFSDKGINEKNDI